MKSRQLIGLLVGTAAGLTLAGCSETEQDAAVGTWEWDPGPFLDSVATLAAENGNAGPEFDELLSKMREMLSVSIEFSSDGTFVEHRNLDGHEITRGTWAVQGDEYILLVPNKRASGTDVVWNKFWLNEAGELAMTRNGSMYMPGVGMSHEGGFDDQYFALQRTDPVN